ncbi:hypothetical protein H0X06_06935 [Candidatus Dependentiae bacterium]|nr:hypothetical protein [Candidatus Dependentiae bacterium]
MYLDLRHLKIIICDRVKSDQHFQQCHATIGCWSSSNKRLATLYGNSACDGIPFKDSFSLRVCHPERISSTKNFFS